MSAHPTRGPFTPAKASRPQSTLQDSPFSDYFTDDARSPDSADTPSPQKRQLLVRLNSLQAQLIHAEHESERHTINIVERKVHEIESQLDALHSQTRMPPEMEDSGLFMEDDDEHELHDEGDDDREHKLQLSDPRADTLHPRYLVTPEQKQAESDYLFLESQRVLESVTKANAQLRQRLYETKSLHDQHNLALEERDQEIAVLRGEKDALKSALASDRSELLFLQLQFKALEAEVEALDQGAQRLESYAPELKEDIQRVKRQRIAEKMDIWRQDCEETSLRMGERTADHVCSAPDNQPTESGTDKAEGWRLETLKQEGTDGKVQTITIRRLTAADSDLLSSPEHDKQYHDISTQTDSLALVSLLHQADEMEEEDVQVEDESDYAITTSSEDDEYDLSSASKTETGPSTLAASAWQELWEGLAGLAGMGEDRF